MPTVPNHLRPRIERLKGDVFGGITAAVIALPLALAFGVASGAGPVAGLYGAFFVGFFAAVFGGTPAQISGPTGPMTVVMASILTKFSHEPAMAFTVVMMGGAFQMLFGILKFGRYINLVPVPVVSGFMTGIGVIIMILQLGPLLGHGNPAGGTLHVLAAFPQFLQSPSHDAIVLGAMTLALVYLLPVRIHKIFPAPLLALILGTAGAWWFFPLAPQLGAIPSGLPNLQMPSFSLHDFPIMVRSALVLAFLGSIDSLLTSLVADSMTRNYHHSDRELIGQGLGNLAAGLFGGIPGAGATMRTVVNVRAGGRTPISGVIHALVLLVVVLGLGSLAAHIPHAVLAGILLKVGSDIIDWDYLRRVRRAPRAGMFIMLTVLTLTVLVDLITAVAAGTIMASLLFVKRMADQQMQSMKLVHHLGGARDLSAEEADILERGADKILLFHIEGPMSFGCARDLVRMLTSTVEKDALIIDLSDVPFIDSSASLAIEEVIEHAHADGDIVILCGLRTPVERVLRKLGVIALLPDECIVNERLEALTAAEAMLDANGSPQ